MIFLSESAPTTGYCRVILMRWPCGAVPCSCYSKGIWTVRYQWKVDRFHLIPISSLLLLLILFYFPVIFLGRTLQGPEMARINPALKAPISAQQIKSGYAVPQIFNTEQATAAYGRFPDDIFTGESYRHLQWPLWDPYVGAGIPFAAQYESSAFFPLRIIQTLFPTSTRDLFFILHMWLAGVFTYCFFIRASLNRLSAFWGATLYMTSGVFSWFMQLQEYMAVGMMLPLLMLATYQLSEKNAVRNVGFLGVVMGLMLYAGQPEAAFYCFVLSFFYYFFRVYSGRAESVERAKHQFTYFISVCLGLCIASPLLVLFIQAYRHGMTIHIMHATASIPLPGLNARSPLNLLTETILPKITDWPVMPLVVPAAAEWDFYGSYVGIIPFFFLTLGFLIDHQKLKKEFIFFFVFAVCFLMMDIGLWPFDLIGYLPLFRLAWSPRWGGATWSFALISAATYGFYFAQQFSAPADVWTRVIKQSTVVTGIVLYITIVVGYTAHLYNLLIFVLWVFYHPVLLLTTSSLFAIASLATMIYFLKNQPKEQNTWFVCILVLIVSQYYWLPKGILILPDLVKLYSTAVNYEITYLFQFILYLCFFVAIVMLAKRKNIFSYVILSLVYMATVFFQYAVLPGYPVHIKVTQPTPFIQYLQENAGYDRFFAIDGILLPRYAQVFHLYDVRSTSAITVRTYQDFVNAYMNSIKLPDGQQQFLSYVAPVTEGRSEDFFYPPLHRLNRHFKAFCIMGMRYLVMQKSENNLTMITHYPNLFAKLKLVYQDQDAVIYLNPNALPRVFAVSNIVLADSYQIAQKVSAETNINLQKTALVENALPLNWKNDSAVLQETAHIVNYQSNKVMIQVASNRSAFLVLTDIFYPGWSATIDGKETKIYRVDGLFRGVVIPSGQHIVEYHYFPYVFQLGLWVAGIALLLCLIGILL